MSDRERPISQPNHGQHHFAAGLGELGVHPRKLGDADNELLDCRRNCFFCGTPTCYAILEERIVEVEAGVEMACPGKSKPFIADIDYFCAVCATCRERHNIPPAPTTAISAHKTLKG
ncbi:MAG: hypothetical protein AAB669_00305 [Patescibacteria group bacterium]